MITKDTLIQNLIDMGIKETDTLLIHSSYKKIAGEEGVEGGADTVVDALIEYVSPKGLMVFPSMSWKLGYLVNDEGDYIPPFDGPKEGYHPFGNDFHVRTTPSSGLGIIPELARKRPGAVRSLSPTSSLCAFGRDAEEFCAGHEKAPTPLNFQSPWGKLYERHAKILFAGSTMATNSFMHSIEDASNLPGLLHPYVWEYTVEDYDGNVFPVSYHRHVPFHDHYYIKMQPLLIEAGIVKEVKFGHAESQLVLDAHDEAEYMFEVLKKNPVLFTDEYNRAHP